MAFGSSPLFLQPTSGSETYTALQLRGMLDVLIGVDGVSKANDCKVSQRGAGANMSVDVAAGQVAITGGTIANQGTYVDRNTATVNVAISTANPTQIRIDLVCAQVYDDQSDGSGLSATVPIVVAGSPGGGLPATPASALPLAAVLVGAAVTSITNANITDLRVLNGLGDVPKWDVSGGNGQSLPTSPAVNAYSGWTVSNNVGMASVTTSTGATIQQAGRYSASFGTRFTNTSGNPGVRQVFIQQTRGATNVHQATMTVPSSGIDAIRVSDVFQCAAGDVLQAFIYHTSGVTLNIDDSGVVTRFSGFRVGP